MKAKKLKKDSRLTVGVLFPGDRQVYTYLVRKGHKLKLCDELVADSPYDGPQIAFLVRIDKTCTATDSEILYKEVTRKVIPI